jgi:hypothetical protein
MQVDVKGRQPMRRPLGREMLPVSVRRHNTYFTKSFHPIREACRIDRSTLPPLYPIEIVPSLHTIRNRKKQKAKSKKQKAKEGLKRAASDSWPPTSC